MKRRLFHTALAATGLAGGALLAGDAELLAGKWSVRKSNDQGQNYTQTIEVKKDKFVFQILGDSDQVVIHAEGDLKLEKLEPFNAARFTHIRGGNSPSNLDDVDDEYTCIYVLEGDTWTVASNFDKDRGQKASLEAYQRAKAASQAGTLVIDELEFVDAPQSATWYFCFDATVEGVTKRYHAASKGYDRKKITVPMALEIPKARPGQKCSFRLQLDDVDGDECTEEVDNRDTSDFEITERGAKTFKPQDDWKYTLRWHLK